MKPNVFIRARRRGKLCYSWEGHNTWTAVGREYLASMLALASYGPDTPVVASSRIKYMQFGIGGVGQGTIPGAVDTGYPAGEDPHATVGNTYDHAYPEVPLIGTLERPVRFSGGTNPYDTAAPGDVWLSTPALPKFFVEHPSDTSVSIKCFTEVPLAEAGLVVSGSADVNDAYNPVVAYVNFAEPLILMDEVEAEVTWVVSF
jgi:hypothetical protein